MNIKITSKDGITLKTKDTYIREDISVAVDESILGGAGAVIKAKGGWSGTPVPNSGYVENVYLNMALSVDEVVSILENAQVNTGTNAVITYGDNDLTFVETVTNSISTWYIGNFSTLDVYFSSNANGSYADFTGWNTSFTGVVEINSEITQGDVDNSLLSSLISTTPFVQATGEEVILEGEYDGSTVDIDVQAAGGSEPTPVPNSGYVEKVYINTSMSIEEVNDLLNDIPIENDYFVAMDENMTSAINIFVTINDNDNGYYYLIGIVSESGVVTPIFNGASESMALELLGVEFTGWYSDFDGVIEFNNNTVSSVDFGDGEESVGFQNDKLSTLFSIEPFVQSEANVIDLKPYIENKQIPLKINLTNIPSGDGEAGLPIEVLSTEEMDALLVTENIGKIYKYVGTTGDTYTNCELYQVIEEA